MSLLFALTRPMRRRGTRKAGTSDEAEAAISAAWPIDPASSRNSKPPAVSRWSVYGSGHVGIWNVVIDFSLVSVVDVLKDKKPLSVRAAWAPAALFCLLDLGTSEALSVAFWVTMR